MSANYYFDKNYVIPPTKIGDYGKIWGKIAILLDRGNGGGENDVVNMEYNAGTKQRSNTDWVAVGTSTNKSTFFMFLKDDTYSGKIDTAYVMESQPFTMYGIAGAHSAWSACNSVTGFKTPAQFNGTKGTLTEWGSWSTGVTIDAWTGVSTVYSQAFASITVGNVDTTINTWDKNSLPGGFKFTDNKLKAIELADINKIGNQRSTRYTMADGQVEGPHISYRKNTSSAMVAHSGTGYTSELTWLGFYAKFGNRDMNSNPFQTFPTTAEHKITEKGTSGSNNKYEIEFGVEADTVYWIVAEPTGDARVYLTIEGDISNTSE